MQKKYTNGEITVVWKPDQCIHSTNCWRGLIQVFNPGERPWINMGGASSDQIFVQVAQCPSGALSAYSNDRPPAEEAPAPDPEAAAPAEEPAETRVEVQPNGPLLVSGALRIKDRAGNETVRSKTTAFCRCGSSGNKPYCDGSHQRVGFSDE